MKTNSIGYWLPAVLWASLIFFLSTNNFSAEQTGNWMDAIARWIFPGISAAMVERLNFAVRKLAHWSEYFIFALLIYHALRDGQKQWWNLKWCLWTLGIVLVWAFGDELHQWFESNRTANIKDSLLDFLGGSCAMLFCYGWGRLKKN
jgi:VanZ family protein